MIGFITGLASEAECLAALTDPVNIQIAGIGAGNAERCARALIAIRRAPLVSFGLAGGLAADLKPGSIVVADSVITPDGYAYPTDAKFTARLLAALPNAVRRPIAGSRTIVASVDDKAALHRQTRAAAVDMESHQIAKVAHEAGVGFIVVRAICDPSNAALPDAALHAVGADGRPDIARIIARLALRPWDLPGLLRLGAYSRTGHASLRSVAPVIVRSADAGHL
jgi:hopanoid-associated phosphorylase